MAGYVFESITDGQAAGFGVNDYLFFSTSGATARNVSVTPYSTTSGVTTGSGITLAFNGTSHVFNNNLSTASQAYHILFNDNSHLIVGSNDTTAANAGADTFTPSSANGNTLGDSYVVYGLAGNDTLDFSTATTAGNNYLNGGSGADTINGGAANNHIYGNSQFTTAGTTDGADTITVTTGSNYINGNAGADIITVGTATSTGINRVFGGADADTITINGGLGSRASVNGNTGADAITDASSGTNTLRGGADADTITQTGASRDIIMGDAGTDTLKVSGAAGHVAVLTGGTESDTFDFSTQNSGAVANLDSTGASVAAGTSGATTYYQEITDFTQGADRIHLAVVPTTVLHQATGAAFTTVSAAQNYAQQLLDNDTADASNAKVAAVNVGSDTYLFYSDSSTNSAINSVIKLDAISQATVTTGSFI